MDISRQRWDELALLIAIFLVAIVLTHILSNGIPSFSFTPQAFASAGTVSPSSP